MKKKILLASLAGAGIFAASDYFFKMAMTPFNKKPDSKNYRVKIHCIVTKFGLEIFLKKNGVSKLRMD